MKGLLAMRDKFERIVTEALGAEKAAQKKLQEAFEVRLWAWVVLFLGWCGGVVLYVDTWLTDSHHNKQISTPVAGFHQRGRALRQLPGALRRRPAQEVRGWSWVCIVCMYCMYSCVHVPFRSSLRLTHSPHLSLSLSAHTHPFHAAG